MLDFIGDIDNVKFLPLLMHPLTPLSEQVYGLLVSPAVFICGGATGGPEGIFLEPLLRRNKGNQVWWGRAVYVLESKQGVHADTIIDRFYTFQQIMGPGSPVSESAREFLRSRHRVLQSESVQ